MKPQKDCISTHLVSKYLKTKFLSALQPNFIKTKQNTLQTTSEFWPNSILD